ncbi:arginase [Paenibacillus elgii]|uniref:Arginase n=1 Tax=Paenibacillus elgii TaxID=189691 RepID=A0A161S1H0_9BACL|nr:arginase family protein [Paenibacillus elgii]KZE72385.1 arginase [Paenibacillus elgii]
MLAWLAPDNDQPLIKVPVQAYDGTPLENENGLNGRKQLLEQLEAAQHIINAHKPDRIVMFGGDCLVEQAPFAYLNERYGGELGLIWIDAHEAPTEQDSEIIQRLGIKTAGTKELMNSTESLKEWIKESGIKHLAIHLDLDVLDPKVFRSLLFANPEAPYNFSAAGTMQMPQLLHLIKQLSEETDVVGLGITEHLPWDSIHLKNLLGEIPILNN